MAGSDLRIVSELAGHQINLKVGEVEIDFNCNARLRFDPQRQILYVKPVVDMMNATQNGGQDDLGQALVALLNGREFPVSMQDMKPLIARSGGKTLMIAMRFVNIEARRDMLQFSLLPEVSTKLGEGSTTSGRQESRSRRRHRRRSIRCYSGPGSTRR